MTSCPQGKKNKYVSLYNWGGESSSSSKFHFIFIRWLSPAHFFEYLFKVHVWNLSSRWKVQQVDVIHFSPSCPGWHFWMLSCVPPWGSRSPSPVINTVQLLMHIGTSWGGKQKSEKLSPPLCCQGDEKTSCLPLEGPYIMTGGRGAGKFCPSSSWNISQVRTELCDESGRPRVIGEAVLAEIFHCDQWEKCSLHKLGLWVY